MSLFILEYSTLYVLVSNVAANGMMYYSIWVICMGYDIA